MIPAITVVKNAVFLNGVILERIFFITSSGVFLIKLIMTFLNSKINLVLALPDADSIMDSVYFKTELKSTSGFR